jgi:predicted nucleotidyltransferase component of viral defense system
MNEVYLATARLLVQVAPLVFEGDTFALKGGSAINLFVRDMPRLSVDLDLVFPDHRLPREQALAQISASIRRSADRLARLGFQAHVAETEAGVTVLLVRRGRIEVKVEANYVMRGTVNPIRRASLVPAARDILRADLEIPMVSLEDLYAGKLVAALDRQHPRDLFDVMHLLAHEGITPGIRRTFVVYLASSSRPVHEVLFPVFRDIRHDYARNFEGMTGNPVSLDALLDTRQRLVTELRVGLDDAERGFLRSFVAATPDWSLLGIPHLHELPAIRWKLQNLEQLRQRDPAKFAAQAGALAAGLDG